MGLLIGAMVFPSLAAWLYFVAFGQHPLMRYLYAGSKLVQATLPLLGWWALGKPFHETTSVLYEPVTRRLRGVGMGLASGALLAATVLGAFELLAGWSALQPVPRQVAARLEALGAATPGSYLLLALALSVAHSLFEEYYWRWFVYGQLQRRMSHGWALLLASLSFAAHHWIVVDTFLAGHHRLTATLPFTLSVAFAGGVWCLLLRRYHTLVPSWLGHLLVDGALMWIGYRLVWPG